MSFSFIHAADIHLDSPLRGLEQYDGAPAEKIRNATREAFVNLVDAAVSRKVAFVLLAGDLYDGDWKDYNTGLFFVSQMAILQQKNIPVFLIRGNHDAASQISKQLKLPSNVYELSSKKPETVLLENLNTAIHGQSYSTRAVTDNMALQYPLPIETYFNIGLLHTSASGREGHERYAPCSLRDLTDRGYDYWALGHVHQRERLLEKPYILFPGNIQGRHIKETGSKGCSYVTVSDGEIESVEHIELDVLRWEICEVDAGSEAGDLHALLEKARMVLESVFEKTDGRFLAVRFKFTGVSVIHHQLLTETEHVINNLRAIALEVGQGDIWIEKVKIETSGLTSLEELRSEHTPLAGILDYLREIQEDDVVISELLDEFTELQNKLPYELRQMERGVDYTNPFLLKQRFQEVEDVIITYLTKEESR